jgi:hypothetical protein
MRQEIETMGRIGELPSTSKQGESEIDMERLQDGMAESQ